MFRLKGDLYIHFKILSYLLYLHIFWLEIKIKMCKIYTVLQIHSVTWNTSEINTLNFGHFYMSLFAKSHVLNCLINMIKD